MIGNSCQTLPTLLIYREENDSMSYYPIVDFWGGQYQHHIYHNLKS